MFGVIMSLSILIGATGHHVYILIYFPFFAPIFSVRDCRIYWWSPLGFVAVVEAVYVLTLWCIEAHALTQLRAALFDQ